MEHTFLRLKCDDDIFSYRKICDNSLCFTIFRKICHTKFHGIQRTVNLCFFSIYLECTPVGFVCTVDGTNQFRTAGTKQSGKSDDFSLIDLEIKRFDRSFMSKSARLDHRRI